MWASDRGCRLVALLESEVCAFGRCQGGGNENGVELNLRTRNTMV